MPGLALLAPRAVPPHPHGRALKASRRSHCRILVMTASSLLAAVRAQAGGL